MLDFGRLWLYLLKHRDYCLDAGDQYHFFKCVSWSQSLEHFQLVAIQSWHIRVQIFKKERAIVPFMLEQTKAPSNKHSLAFIR